MNNYDEYDRGLDPYVDITDEDEGTPTGWVLAVVLAIMAVCAFFGMLFGRD